MNLKERHRWIIFIVFLTTPRHSYALTKTNRNIVIKILQHLMKGKIEMSCVSGWHTYMYIYIFWICFRRGRRRKMSREREEKKENVCQRKKRHERKTNMSSFFFVHWSLYKVDWLPRNWNNNVIRQQPTRTLIHISRMNQNDRVLYSKDVERRFWYMNFTCASLKNMGVIITSMSNMSSYSNKRKYLIGFRRDWKHFSTAPTFTFFLIWRCV